MIEVGAHGKGLSSIPLAFNSSTPTSWFNSQDLMTEPKRQPHVTLCRNRKKFVFEHKSKSIFHATPDSLGKIIVPFAPSLQFRPVHGYRTCTGDFRSVAHSTPRLGRKPRESNLNPGLNLPRLAERQILPLLNQLPPRSTRFEPVEGPTGSVTLPEG